MFDRNKMDLYNIIKLNLRFDGIDILERGNQMKSTGIIRKVDELGRIVLPIELRRTLDIAERDELEIYMEGDRIVLQKFEPSCIFCASAQGLVSYRGKNICQDCLRNMAKY